VVPPYTTHLPALGAMESPSLCTPVDPFCFASRIAADATSPIKWHGHLSLAARM